VGIPGKAHGEKNRSPWLTPTTGTDNDLPILRVAEPMNLIPDSMRQAGRRFFRLHSAAQNIFHVRF
jgi:hypothetical protein